MMNLMRATGLALLMAALIPAPVHAQAKAKNKADAATMEWRYEIRPMGVGAQGSALVEVSSYSKRTEVAVNQARKNAVHGILFKGYGGMAGVPGRAPLIKDPAFPVNQRGFMETFFKDGGDYARFVGQMSEDIRNTDMGKENKIEVVVTVLVDELRRYMESLGHINPNAGF